jgi:hypothetical protein
MSDSVPVAEAMEQAQAALAAEQPPVDVADAVEGEAAQDSVCWCGLTHPAGVAHVQPEDAPPPVEAAAPEQAELFPPPPPPPFDFEQAYEALARADQRARIKKSAWEACKRDTKEARGEYDEALEALLSAFTRVDVERRNAERQQQLKQPILRPVADAAPTTTEAETPTEGGEEQTMSDLEQTIDEVPEEKTEKEPDEASTEEEEADAPSE